jgi:hypothetical protein
LAEKCGFISARLCFFGREKSERQLILFSTQKQPERWLLANHNRRSDANFGWRVNQNPGLLQKSGPRVDLGQQRGAAIRQKIKKVGRSFWVRSFSKTTLPQNLSFLSLFNFFPFFTMATFSTSNGSREKLLPAKVKSGSLR